MEIDLAVIAGMVAAVLGAILGSSVITAIIVAIATRPKTTAEADKLHAEANGERAESWQRLVDALEKRVQSLEERMVVMEGDVRELCRGVDILSTQLADEGLQPAWTPPADLAARYNITPPVLRKRPVSGRLGPQT